MADVTTRAGSTSSDGMTGAFGAARELLDDAAAEATRRRSEADRYARQREQEAELLVQKARRLLHAAEEKAAVIVASARTERVALDHADGVIDLDALARASGSETAEHGVPSRLDDLLASAISHALTDAFAEDTSA